MALRTLFNSVNPGHGWDPNAATGSPDALPEVRHAYTVWDEEKGHHWFLVDHESPVERRTFYVLSDTQDHLEPNSFWSAIEEALRQGHFSIHISKGSWTPCELVDRFQGPNLIVSSLSSLHLSVITFLTESSLLVTEPIVEESSLRFVRRVLDDHGLELVEMDGELYVHKFAVIPELLMVLQCEVESYQRLEQSPFVLRISHAVRSTSSKFGGECIRGFLLPFTGEALASTTGWTTEQKESIMLDLFDAVHDFEVRGAVHTDLKCANILLTPDGMKLIDLDFLGSTTPWKSPFVDDSRQAAVHTFGKTVWELFAEQVPHGTTLNEAEVEGSLPPYVAQFVRDCCFEHKYKCIKQVFDATEQLLEPVRVRRTPTAKLVASRQATREDDVSKAQGALA